MTLAASLVNGHVEDSCILCLAGWLWQAEVGVVSRELRQLVLWHRRCHAEQAMRRTATGRCMDCGLVHEWTHYSPTPTFDDFIPSSERCKPPPWVCHFGAGTICRTYRAALFLQHPDLSAWEVVTCAAGESEHMRGCTAFGGSLVENKVDRDLDYLLDDDIFQEEYFGIFVEESDNDANASVESVEARRDTSRQIITDTTRIIQTRHYDAIRSQGVQARRVMGGVRMSPQKELTTIFCDMHPELIPRENEDAAELRLAAALCWTIRADCRAELPWLAKKMMEEIAQFMRSIADKSFALGWQAVVGYVSDMLVDFEGQWTKRFLWASAATRAGDEIDDRHIKQTSLDIFLDGRWAFTNRSTWSAQLKSIYFDLLLGRNKIFRKYMSRGLRYLDIDICEVQKEAYASREGCFTFAEFHGSCSARRGDVFLFMEKESEPTYQVVGAEVAACISCAGGFVLMLDVDHSKDFKVHIFPKPRRVQECQRAGVMKDWDSDMPELAIVGFCKKNGLAGTRRVETRMRILDPCGHRAVYKGRETNAKGWEIEVSEAPVKYSEHWAHAGGEFFWARAGAGQTLRAHPLETSTVAFDLPLCFFHALFVFGGLSTNLQYPDWLFENVGGKEYHLGSLDDLWAGGLNYDGVLQLSCPSETKETTESCCTLTSWEVMKGKEIIISREKEAIILTLSSGARFSTAAPRSGEGTLALFFEAPEELSLTFASEHCEVVYASETSAAWF
jgi:hypothetical protein